MPCTPRTPGGRTDARDVVYPKKGKEVKIPVGGSADVLIPKKDMIENFKAVSKEDLIKFPEKVHVVMNENKITISDVFTDKEITTAKFIKDDKGWKITKEFDDLAIWMYFFRGLMKKQINITIFYEGRAREGLYG